jgi:hypothetical protein
LLKDSRLFEAASNLVQLRVDRELKSPLGSYPVNSVEESLGACAGALAIPAALDADIYASLGIESRKRQ